MCLGTAEEGRRTVRIFFVRVEGIAAAAMASSAKRKQDERNLKTLRELVSQPGNKECFDCNQRGPTYVNMTIGSFVCTSCSGML